ncbi:hypothetical protein H0H81_002870 [Sphagnurus paluster]|uniref:Cytochrome P450 n=1 Tax=Sphagnurus paluster TaxID=117069 RepID=A0A9P7GTR4_9AGAR|nr:hypothetical protein H0H81_002870 [Sphagnurus paluster]
MVILNSVEAAVDMMEKRSSNYSDRAPMPYGMVKNLGRNEIWQGVPDPPEDLPNLLTNPREKKNLINRFTTSIIIYVTYGHRVTSDEDRYVILADEVGRGNAEAGTASGALLDFQLPEYWEHEMVESSCPSDGKSIVEYLPSWFPGTHYVNHARKWAPKVKEFHDFPFEQERHQMEGTAKPCLVASGLQAIEDNNANSTKTISDIKGAAGQTYFGDKLIPFRILRGIPHLSIEDDVYKGMFIPNGSTIVANVRGMSWDEKVYANPFNFEPTRYLPAPLGRGEPRPIAHLGFGRRICPGRHFADSSLWIAIATILSTFSISKALDEDGNEITPELTFVTTITSRPKSFPFCTKPRSEEAARLLSQVDITDDY